jgi:hypothetical protein
MTCLTCQRDYWEHPHCPDCHRTWHGHAECHCAECHHHFGSDTAFLVHQAAGECRDPATILDGQGEPRLKPVKRKDGLVWVSNRDRHALRGLASGPGGPSRKRVA